jgi:hypothetical protein
MKRIIASAGLVALGAASLQAADAPGLSPQEQSKPWSIGLILRGFYDDNPTASPNHPTAGSGVAAPEASWGLEVSPYVNINKALDQTMISFNYTYDLRWFENRPENNNDQAHFLSLDINHKFSDRYALDISDHFTVGKDPTVQFNDGVQTFLRTDGNYTFNNARAGFDAWMSEKFGLSIAYVNNLWDFSQTGVNSRSAYLDRMDQYPVLEAKYRFNPNTVGLLGVQYGNVNHTASAGSNQILITDASGFVLASADPDVRNLSSIYGYVGVEQTFNPQLTAAVRLGVLYTSYDNVNDLGYYNGYAPGFSPNADDTSTDPYADASLTWSYNPGCSLKVGIINTINQTDVTALSQASTVGYANLVHRISSKVTGSLMGLIQSSQFNGGIYDGETDMIYMIGVNLNYAFNQYLSADLGYNFDRDSSEIPDRSYSRNRVYFGLHANY